MSTVVVKPPSASTVVVRRASSPTVVNRSVIKETTTQDDGTEVVVSRQVVRTAVSRPAATREVVKKEVSGGTVVRNTGPRISIVHTGAAEVLPNRTLRGQGMNRRYLYVGFSSAAIGAENEAAAEWKIYRYDTVTDTSSFSDGDELFDNVWDDRESLTYP